jgi:Ser/Thr protein kinase RdoA (MazF antagonist)
MSSPPNPSDRVLTALGLSEAKLTLFPTGLINTTWLATLPDGEKRVLQRVNSLFPPEVNDDISIVTQHLDSLDIMTPLLIPATDGTTIFEDDEDIVWRQMTHVPGVTYDALANGKQAEEAGALLGRFHCAVGDLEHEFSMARLGVHDTSMHLRNLLDALIDHDDHEHYERIDMIASQILILASDIPNLGGQPDRVVHGDPKISNVVFDESTDEAICLIDFDTMSRMPVVLELGDAFRSWCNPHAEDEPGAEFSLPMFESAIAGYARETRDFLTESEWRKIPGAAFTITVELAARFCAAALNENYFGGDDKNSASASAHNQARTRSQIDLARSIAEQLPMLEDVVHTAFEATAIER